MKIYMVRHEFRNGEANFVVRSDHLPTEEELNTKLALNFEPEKDEYIIIDEIDEILNLNEL